MSATSVKGRGRKLVRPMVLNLVDNQDVRYLRLEIHQKAVLTQEDIEAVNQWMEEFREKNFTKE